MKLSTIAVKNKIITVEHPNYEGFSVDIEYMSKETLKRLLEAASTQKFSKKTHQLEEDTNNELFLKLYTKALIKGWKGLKLKYVMELMPIEIDNSQLEDKLEYDEDNALTLIKNSNEFDQWISSVSGEVGKFSMTKSKVKRTT